MKKILLGIVALALGGAGCFTVHASVPGSVRGDVKDTETEKVTSFQVEKTNYFFLWGLVGSPPEDFFATEIKKQVQAKGADGVSGLTVDSENSCGDLAIGCVTVGIVCPRTYKISADVVRIRTAPLPGKTSKAVSSTPNPSVSTAPPAGSVASTAY